MCFSSSGSAIAIIFSIRSSARSSEHIQNHIWRTFISICVRLHTGHRPVVPSTVSLSDLYASVTSEAGFHRFVRDVGSHGPAKRYRHEKLVVHDIGTYSSQSLHMVPRPRMCTVPTFAAACLLQSRYCPN